MMPTRRLVDAQVALLGISAAVTAPFGGWPAFDSAAYGGVCGIVLTWALGRSAHRAAHAAPGDPRTAARVLYAGAAWRFGLAAVLVGTGFHFFGVRPLPCVIGFAATRLAFGLDARALFKEAVR
ncbi:MAG: ATP synthase subunit I [Betaproteobacteria bacterium]|nr:ATP synthase subunit I [Betaproteobacteria bacterium]